MTKKELVDKIAAKTLLKKQDIEKVIDNAIEITKETIAQNETLFLRGFGTFQAKERNPRKARNIKAGTVVMLPATAVPFFKPCKSFKKLVSEKYNQKIY